MNIETNEMFWDKLKNILKEAFSKKAEADIEPIGMEDLSKEVETELEEQVEPTVEEPQATVEEPVVEEPKAEEPKVEEPVVEEEPKVEEKPQENNAHLEELINSLKEEISALKEMNNGLNDKVKELSKEPSAKPVNTNAKPSGSSTYSAWREQLRNMIR